MRAGVQPSNDTTPELSFKLTGLNSKKLLQKQHFDLPPSITLPFKLSWNNTFSKYSLCYQIRYCVAINRPATYLRWKTKFSQPVYRETLKTVWENSAVRRTERVNVVILSLLILPIFPRKDTKLFFTTESETINSTLTLHERVYRQEDKEPFWCVEFL